VFRLNSMAAGQSGWERALRRNTKKPRHLVEAAHNPEVAGSNPAPATFKGPGDRAFFCRGTNALLVLQALLQALQRQSSTT